jgi:hypothetical protein
MEMQLLRFFAGEVENLSKSSTHDAHTRKKNLRVNRCFRFAARSAATSQLAIRIPERFVLRMPLGNICPAR